jgi:hypothetical protein
MHPPKTYQLYWQHLCPLRECDEDDGRVVGHLLRDLVESKPKDLAHAVRTFANRTTMLRECGFRHIGAMLASLLSSMSAGTQGGPDNFTAIVALDPSSVTEKQAIAFGHGIVSVVRQSHVPATALQRVVESHQVLRSMKTFHWFVPMLEVITVQAADLLRRSADVLRRSTRAKRLTLSTIAPINRTSNIDEFSAVVRPGALRVQWLLF